MVKKTKIDPRAVKPDILIQSILDKVSKIYYYRKQPTQTAMFYTFTNCGPLTKITINYTISSEYISFSDQINDGFGDLSNIEEYTEYTKKPISYIINEQNTPLNKSQLGDKLKKMLTKQNLNFCTF